MMFEVLVDVWHYRPKRCTMVTYRKGQKGCLPADHVQKAAARGLVKILEANFG